LKEEDRVVVGRPEGLRPGTVVNPREQPAPPKPESPPEKRPQSAAPPVRGHAGPAILVEAVYPGANASVVRDTVAAPIEQQVNGVENLLSLRSRCTNDGRYALVVTFARRTDLAMNQVLVQNRVALAMPTLPDSVKMSGLSVKQEAVGVLMILTLSSPDGSLDPVYLGNYAAIQLRDELTRVAGVGAVNLLGPGESGVRIWLDPDKLAARNLNAGEAARAIEKAREQGGSDPEKLADLILKADGEGRLVRLRDVANIEMGAGRSQSEARLNGKPVVALLIHPTGQVAADRVSAAVQERLSDLRSNLPRGLDLGVAFDFTPNLEAPDQPNTPEYLLLDLDLPYGTSFERTLDALQRCATLLRERHGVQDVLTLTDHPFDPFGDGPCVLVRLVPAEKRKAGREEIRRAIRTQMAELKDVRVRLRDLSGHGRFPRCGYPLDVALCGPESERVREWAGRLAELLGRSRMLTDVGVNSASTPRPQQFIDIDRTAAAVRGVSMEDVLSTLRVLDGPLNVNDVNRFGRTWTVTVQAVASGDWAKDLRTLKVRNGQGQMIPLGTLVKVRDMEGPQAVDYLDFTPMVELTANPAQGVSMVQARTLCEKLAEEVRKELRLPGNYRLRWLPEITGPR
jgi:multidrug efflux pump subunit AcrB